MSRSDPPTFFSLRVAASVGGFDRLRHRPLVEQAPAGRRHQDRGPRRLGGGRLHVDALRGLVALRDRDEALLDHADDPRRELVERLLRCRGPRVAALRVHLASRAFDARRDHGARLRAARPELDAVDGLAARVLDRLPREGLLAMFSRSGIADASPWFPSASAHATRRSGMLSSVSPACNTREASGPPIRATAAIAVRRSSSWSRPLLMMRENRSIDPWSRAEMMRSRTWARMSFSGSSRSGWSASRSTMTRLFGTDRSARRRIATSDG